MNLGPWRFYAGFIADDWKRLLAPALLAVTLSFAALPLAFLVVKLFQETIPAGNIKSVVLIGLSLMLLNIFLGASTYWIRTRVLSVVKDSVEELRNEIVKRLCTLSRQEYVALKRSELHSKIVHDTSQLDVFGNLMLAQVLPATAVILPLSIVLIWLNWYLFIVSFAVLPLLVYVTKVMGKGIHERWNAFRKEVHSFSSGVLFVVQAMDLTRVQSAEKYEVERQQEKVNRMGEAGRSVAWINMTYQVIQTTVSTSYSFIVLTVGGIAVIYHFFSIAELISFYVILSLVKVQVNTILSAAPTLIQSKESLKTLYDFLFSGKAQPYTGKKQIEFQGNIHMESLSFNYGDNPLLRDIHLNIHAGKITAILGANGSGKSTLASLILGLNRPSAGKLCADHHSYDDLDIVHFRRYLGVVMQDPMMFPGSILDNLTYGSADSAFEEVVRAAEISTAHDFIRELPEGYETEVGERGVLLSGGQCQRIAIARALLRRPRLLILDEPTTHIDRSNIVKLIENLRALSSMPAILLIGHDQAVLDHADEVYSLEQGVLMPQGIQHRSVH